MTTVDIFSVGRGKAGALAAERGVVIQIVNADLTEWASADHEVDRLAAERGWAGSVVRRVVWLDSLVQSTLRVPF